MDHRGFKKQKAYTLLTCLMNIVMMEAHKTVLTNWVAADNKLSSPDERISTSWSTLSTVSSIKHVAKVKRHKRHWRCDTSRRKTCRSFDDCIREWMLGLYITWCSGYLSLLPKTAYLTLSVLKRPRYSWDLNTISTSSCYLVHMCRQTENT